MFDGGTQRFSPQHRGTPSFCRGPGTARPTAEESDLRSSAAPRRATLVQSTQEHHLEKDKAASGGLGEVRGGLLPPDMRCADVWVG